MGSIWVQAGVSVQRLTLSGAVISSRQNDVSAMELSPAGKASRRLQVRWIARQQWRVGGFPFITAGK